MPQHVSRKVEKELNRPNILVMEMVTGAA
eukprot:SAG11_NODE_14789_length_599_cov_1.416000_1_plen_28_part_10